MCEKRLNSKKYDDMSWSDYVSNLSPELRRWAVDSTSIYLGMEYDEINAHLIMDLMRHNQSSPVLSNSYDFYSFNNSINMTWFDQWKEQLRENGVVFHMHNDIQEIVVDDNNAIKEIIVKDTWWNKKHVVSGDVFINGLSIENLGYLYPSTTPELKLQHDDFNKLAERGHQIQTQILYRLNSRINEDKNTVYILPDTPWFLMTRHEGSLWNLKDCDILSAGIGIWNKPGLNGKCAINCSPEELAKECWEQMLKFDIPLPVNMPEWDIWNNFEYSEEDEKIWTWEPKFSNNVGTLHIRPETKDKHIQNLYHATAYTHTSMNIFNMESAAEAGLKAAKTISNTDIIVNTSYKPNLFFKFIQWVDNLVLKISSSFQSLVK